MTKTLQGKKLLILGGNALTCDIVNTANKMGVYTIVSDWNKLEDSPAKQIACEFWDISLMDYEKLSERIKKDNVLGMITGFTDSYLLPYQHLCELNGLPCYGTKEQFEKTLDKARFKYFCKTNGVEIVPEYDVKTFNKETISEENKIIIKPVDNSGSRGICLCSHPSEYEKMLDYALNFSQKKEVVLERYMECDDVSFEYVIQDGVVMLSSICDRYIHKTKSGGSVTSKLIYPSKYTEQYIKEADGKVKQMFQNMGLKNGVLFMQAFVEDGHFYFYEMGYRLSGGRHYIFTENQNGTNAVKELIYFAFYGKMAENNLSQQVSPLFKNICCQLSVLCKSDKIGKIVGKSRLKENPEIIDSTFYYQEGDVIGKEGTTSQIVARLHIVVQNQQQLTNVIKSVKQTLSIINDKGENIIVE